MSKIKLFLLMVVTTIISMILHTLAHVAGALGLRIASCPLWWME